MADTFIGDFNDIESWPKPKLDGGVTGVTGVFGMDDRQVEVDVE